jgi:hypothetical protein
MTQNIDGSYGRKIVFDVPLELPICFQPIPVIIDLVKFLFLFNFA